MAGRNETQERRTTVPNSGGNEDCGRGTGEENVELNNIFVPKEYNPELDTIEKLNGP